MESILHRVSFVKAKEPDRDVTETKPRRQKLETSESEGNDARDFYESVVGKTDDSLRLSGALSSTMKGPEDCGTNPEQSASHSNTSKKRRSRESLGRGSEKEPSSSVSLEAQSITTRAEVDLNARLRKGSGDFLRCAQEGDLRTMKLHADRGVDINSQDAYGWTGLMCAAQAGNTDIVQFLLERGANAYLVDNQWRTALNIAESVEPENSAVCRMLRDFMHGEPDWRAVKEPEIVQHERFYCEKCEREFSDTTKTQHETSTIHLFNAKPKETRSTFYHLTENNKGFKLLVQSGWDKEKGLGPDGKGNKFPVKTVLKRDRLGLGNTELQSSAKITHFKPHDTEAVKRPRLERNETKERNLRKSTISKRKQAKLLSEEQQKERDFRLSFNIDF